MSSLYRGAKNAFRSAVRTFAVVLILALCVGLAIAMALGREAVDARIDAVKSTVGTGIIITPAGSQNFLGGGEPLSQANLSVLNGTAHVTAIDEALVFQIPTNETSLHSGVQAGTLGGRQGGDGGGRGGRGGRFQPPILGAGQSSFDALYAFGDNSYTLVNGTKPDATSNESVALVGTLLSQRNGLHPGSTFLLFNTTITVAGVFNASNTFVNNLVLLPLERAQYLVGTPGEVSRAVVKVDSIGNVNTATQDIRATLGDTADVTPQQAAADQAVAPLESISSVALGSMIGALIAGSLIMLLTMVMIVRERRKEIGVLKAIGASNVRIATQFFAESACLVTLGAVLGIAFGALISDHVVGVLAATSGATTPQQGGGFGGRGGGGNGFFGGGGFGTQSLVNSVHTTYGLNVLAWAAFAIILISIVGSAVPAWFIANVRPGEVLRGD